MKYITYNSSYYKMCTLPPPVPPPLPPPPITTSSPAKVKNSCNACQLLMDDPYICGWAASDMELRRACILGRICTDKPPYRYKYKSFESIIQVGPTCGIVALSMLVNGDISPEEILNIARLEGFTNNGEMFSCKNMGKLAEKVFSLADVDNIHFTINNGSLYSLETIDDLLNGAVILVPYDPDVNHMPTLRNGHTAHWAVICGVIIVNEPLDPYVLEEDNIFVLCRHGKSKFVTAWNFAKLAASNINLWEFSPKKQNDGLVYIMPEGGMGGENGLRGQFLTFKWK